MKVFDSHMHWRDPVTNRYELLSEGVSDDGGRGGSAAQTYLPDEYLGEKRSHISAALAVTSRTVVRLFLEQFRFEFVPVLHGLQGGLASQG